MTREDAELWEAARTVEMHAPGLDGCAQCPTDGPASCRRLQWADYQLRRWQARTGQRPPTAKPAYRPAPAR